VSRHEICPCGISTPHAHPVPTSAPINWPARLRRAALAAETLDPMEADGDVGIAVLLRHLAWRVEDGVPSDMLAAVGRALLGEED
jgi:hypothetical protein